MSTRIINLQLFADGDGQGGGSPTPQPAQGTSTPATGQVGAPAGGNLGVPQGPSTRTPEGPPVSLAAALEQAAARQQQQQQQQTAPSGVEGQPQPVEFDFAGKRIQVTDPTLAAALREVHQEFQERSRLLTQEREAARQAQLEAERWRQLASAQLGAAQTGQTQQQPHQQQEPLLTEEEVKELGSLVFEDEGKFAQKLLEITQKIVDKRLDAELAPIRMQREWDQAAETLARTYPDFRDLAPVMNDLMNREPHLVRTPADLERLYWRAKLHQVQSQQTAAAVDPNDPQLLDRLRQNPELWQRLRDAAVSEYLSDKSQQAQATPPILAQEPGGQAVMAPPTQPRSIQEASQQFRQTLRARGMG